MNLNVKNTARPAVRSMAEVKKILGAFSVFKLEFELKIFSFGLWRFFKNYRKILIDFGGFWCFRSLLRFVWRRLKFVFFSFPRDFSP